MILVIAIVLALMSWFFTMCAGSFLEEHHREKTRKLASKSLFFMGLSFLMLLMAAVLFYKAGAA